MASYYAQRAARDPQWADEQRAGAAERARRRRKLDPEGVKLGHRLAARRERARSARAGLTFHELLGRVGGDPADLRVVLRAEIALGRVEYHSTSRRYVLKGGLDPATREALLRIGRWRIGAELLSDTVPGVRCQPTRRDTIRCIGPRRATCG